MVSSDVLAKIRKLRDAYRNTPQGLALLDGVIAILEADSGAEKAAAVGNLQKRATTLQKASGSFDPMNAVQMLQQLRDQVEASGDTASAKALTSAIAALTGHPDPDDAGDSGVAQAVKLAKRGASPLAVMDARIAGTNNQTVKAILRTQRAELVRRGAR